jgi:hypothetical protein
MKSLFIVILALIAVASGIFLYSQYKQQARDIINNNDAAIASIVYRNSQYYQKANGEYNFSSVDEMMDKLSGNATTDAKISTEMTLIFGVESFESLEYVLGILHDSYKADNNSVNVYNYAMVYGAYIGESIKYSVPGSRWEKDHDVGGSNSYPLHWNNQTSFPCVWCYKRIVNGPKDNVWHKYLALK